MKCRELLRNILKKFESYNFDDTLKVVQIMGKYIGCKILKDDEPKNWSKIFVRFLQLVTLEYTLRMAWSAYYCRHDFLKFIYYFIMFINGVMYSSYQLTWINREDKLNKLLKWCRKQSEEPAYRLLDGWPKNYYNCNRFAHNLLITWIIFSQICLATGGIGGVPIIFSLYLQEYTLVVPSLAIFEENLNFWTFTITVIESTIYMNFIGLSIAVTYLTYIFSTMFLSFRLDAIEELIEKLSKNVTEENQYLNRDLLNFIVDLQVDAYE